MEWLGWFFITLIAIPFIYGFTVLLSTPGSILRKPRKIDKDYVYQAPMLKRHTYKRKSETRLEKAEWDLEFTRLEALTSANYMLEMNLFVPVSVLEFAMKNDRTLYEKLQIHNDRLQSQREIERFIRMAGLDNDY